MLAKEPTCDAATQRACSGELTPVAKAASPSRHAAAVRSAIKSPTRRSSSARRLTGTGETLHVHVNPCPDVIEVGGGDAAEDVPQHDAGAGLVANELADIGSQGNPHRGFLLELAGMLLRRRPPSPEQSIVDHLYSRQLPTTVAVPNGRVVEVADADAPAVVRMETEGVGTVAERLVAGLAGCPAGRAVALRYATLLLHRKPDDAEDFLWTRLEGRSFGGDAAVTNALSCTADAVPTLSPDDPTQVALLKEMPLNTPGYTVAANMMALLFTRKPDNAVSFLYYHYSGRVHSSAAASVRSSSRRHGAHVSSGSEEVGRWHVPGEVSEDSRTSRELVAQSSSSSSSGHVSGAVSEDDDNGSSSEDDALVACVATPLPRGGSFGSFGDSLQLPRRHGRHCGRTAKPTRGLCSPKKSLTTRTPTQLGCESESARLHAPRHVTIAQCQDSATTARAESATTTTSPRPSAAVAASRDVALIRHEYELLRLREEHRRWRTLHEVETLRQECAFRERLTRYDRSEQAAAAARAACEVLQEAERYLHFLDAQASRLQDDMQRFFGEGTSGVPAPAPPPFSNVATVTRPPASSPGAGVPSELDILKKRVELLTMEQERAYALMQQEESHTVPTTAPRRGSNVSGRRAHD